MNAINNLRTAVAASFPGRELHFNKHVLWKGLGGSGIVYDFAFTPGYANIFHNANGLIRISINCKDFSVDINEVDPVEVECNLFDHRFRNAGIKFRKINAKNLDAACAKIAAWFEKNAAAMSAVQF